MSEQAPDEAVTAGEVESEDVSCEQSADSTVDELRQQAEDHRNKYLRAVAELENLRKRNVRELENVRKYGVERLAAAILPVRDSIEAALALGDGADVKSLLEGERATLRLLDQALEGAGVSEVDPHGEPFDPAKHEAMSVQPSSDVEASSVLEVIQKGYEIYDRLIRPARVIVASEPAKGEDE